MQKTTHTTATKAAYNGRIPNTPLGYFWHVSKPFKWWMFAAVLIVIISETVGQGSAYLIKLIIDAVESGEADKVWLYALMYPTLVFLVQTSYRTSAYCARQWVIGARKVGYDELTAYILRHSNAYFSDRFAGSLMSKVNNVVDSVDHISVTMLWTHLTALTSFVVTFIFVVYLDLWAGLLFLALAVVLITLNRFMAKEKALRAKANAEARTKLRGQIVDTFTNVQAVRQYTNLSDEQGRISELTTQMNQANHRNWAYTEYMLYINGLILFLFSVAMFWLLVQSWQAGTIGTGDFVLVIALYAQVTGTLIFIGRAVNETARAVGEIEEGLEDILIDHEIVDAIGAATLSVAEGQIQWQQVTFEFGDNAVFKDFDLTIKPGQRVGLVGHSGAGKTTFVSLLLRQHDVMAGAILIDGQNIAEVTQDSLREHIAVVPQEPMLFHRTIKENIAYGKPGATDEEIITVAQKAQAHDFIMAQEEGYDTLVGERGVKLSGGQKQRVAIARAMLKDAPILILDEATSALDSESEVEIQRALHQLMVGKTVIAVAHRLSTLREMDRIIVLDKGRVIEDGSHDALVAYGGVYARLWEHQAGGFIVD